MSLCRLGIHKVEDVEPTPGRTGLCYICATLNPCSDRSS